MQSNYPPRNKKNIIKKDRINSILPLTGKKKKKKERKETESLLLVKVKIENESLTVSEKIQNHLFLILAKNR